MAEPKKPVERDERGRIKPGSTLNPGGVPKQVAELRRLLEGEAKAAIEVVKRLLDSEDDKVALAAAREVLDRVMGKPAQAVKLEGDETAGFLARLFKGKKEGDDE